MSVIKPETNQNASEPSITFSIDGQAMQAAPGETILQVAERHGVQIPTLCHSKKTSHNTSCFV